MDIDRAKLLAARPDALAAKDEFISEFRDDLRLCAVGLGVSDDGTDWTLKVYVQDPACEPHLPDHFHRFAVDVETIGPVTALSPRSACWSGPASDPTRLTSEPVPTDRHIFSVLARGAAPLAGPTTQWAARGDDLSHDRLASDTAHAIGAPAGRVGAGPTACQSLSGFY